jgi:hypothetical protein
LHTWRYVVPKGAGIALDGPWSLEFLRGGPSLPAATTLEHLSGWTGRGDDAADRFAGTGRYRLDFDAPSMHADEWQLDLGDVREAAKVSLNGEVIADAWSLPFVVRLGDHLRPGRNRLEIEVTNLPANRVRDLDVRHENWKIMRDINLASLRYGAFDASGWPVAPSGLVGPVRLVPLEVVSPR